MELGSMLMFGSVYTEPRTTGSVHSLSVSISVSVLVPTSVSELLP